MLSSYHYPLTQLLATNFQHRLEASHRLDHDQPHAQHSFGHPVAASACSHLGRTFTPFLHTCTPTCSTRGRHRLYAGSAPTHTLTHSHTHLLIPSTHTHPTRRPLAPEARGTVLSRTHCCRRVCWTEPSPIPGCPRGGDRARPKRAFSPPA